MSFSKYSQPAVVIHNLKFYDTDKMNPMGHIFIHGKKGSGKSTVAGHIIYCISKIGTGKIRRVAVMSGTESYNHAYEKNYGVKPEYIRNGFDKQFLETLVTHQQKKAALPNVGGNNPKNGLLIILDDLAFKKSIFEDELIMKIMYNGRHFNITLMMIVQEPVSCPKSIRNSFEYIITTRESMPAQQKNLYESYFGNFINLKTFVANLKHHTKENHVLWLDNSRNEDRVEDCIYTFKAPFRLDGEIIEITDERHPEYELNRKRIQEKE
ncbi:MAG: ATPase/DNA packaging protein, partial [Nanoarchaeota archaeon]